MNNTTNYKELLEVKDKILEHMKDISTLQDHNFSVLLTYDTDTDYIEKMKLMCEVYALKRTYQELKQLYGEIKFIINCKIVE